MNPYDALYEIQDYSYTSTYGVTHIGSETALNLEFYSGTGFWSIILKPNNIRGPGKPASMLASSCHYRLSLMQPSSISGLDESKVYNGMNERGTGIQTMREPGKVVTTMSLNIGQLATNSASLILFRELDSRNKI